MFWLRWWRRLAAWFDRARDSSPRGILRRARAELDEDVARLRKSLGRAAADVGRLDARLAAAETRGAELDQRIAAYEKVGQASLVATLRQERLLLDEGRRSDEREREAARRLQEGLLGQARALHEAFRERVGRVERLLDEVEEKEGRARAAAGLDTGPLSVSGAAALDGLEEELKDRRARAASEVETAARERLRLKG